MTEKRKDDDGWVMPDQRSEGDKDRCRELRPQDVKKAARQR